MWTLPKGPVHTWCRSTKPMEMVRNGFVFAPWVNDRLLCAFFFISLGQKLFWKVNLAGSAEQWISSQLTENMCPTLTRAPAPLQNSWVSICSHNCPAREYHSLAPCLGTQWHYNSKLISCIRLSNILYWEQNSLLYSFKFEYIRKVPSIGNLTTDFGHSYMQQKLSFFV